MCICVCVVSVGVCVYLYVCVYIGMCVWCVYVYLLIYECICEIYIFYDVSIILFTIIIMLCNTNNFYMVCVCILYNSRLMCKFLSSYISGFINNVLLIPLLLLVLPLRSEQIALMTAVSETSLKVNLLLCQPAF